MSSPKWNCSPNPASSFSVPPKSPAYTCHAHSALDYCDCLLAGLMTSFQHGSAFFTALLHLSLITLQQLCTHSNENPDFGQWIHSTSPPRSTQPFCLLPPPTITQPVSSILAFLWLSLPPLSYMASCFVYEFCPFFCSFFGGRGAVPSSMWYLSSLTRV